MTDDSERIRLADRVQFATPAGESVSLILSECWRSSDGHRIEASLRGEYDTWQRLLAEGWFHLDAVTERPDLHPDRDVEMHVRLRPGLTQAVPGDLTDLGATIADPESPLGRTASWFVTAIVPASSDETVDGNVADVVAQVGVETCWASILDDDTETAAIDQITEHFDDQGWEYERPERGFVSIEITVGGRPLPVYVYTDGPAGTCQLYAVHPDEIPESNWDELTRTLATRNYELERGAFGLNEIDGTVRYRRRADLDREHFGQVFDDTVAAMAMVFEDLAGLADPSDV